VGRIEREFLNVLDFQLGIKEADLLAHHDILSSLTSSPSSSLRNITSVPAIKPVTPSLLQVPSSRPHSRVSDYQHSPSSSGSSSSSYSSPLMPRSSSSSDTSRSPSLSGSPIIEECTLPIIQPPPRRPLKAAPRLSATTLDILRAFPVPRYHQRTAAAAAGNGKADSKLQRTSQRTSHRTSMIPPPALFT
jgi:hypothetical protein